MDFNGLGDIAIFKDLIFNSGKADFAFVHGRPGIILGEKDDKLYIMPFSSRNFKYWEDFKFPINDNQDFMFNSIGKGNRDKNINVYTNTILKHNIYGYKVEAKLKNKLYLKLLKYILTSNLNGFSKTKENLEEIEEDLIKQYNYLSKKIR